LAKEPDATLYDHLGDILQKLGKPDRAREAWKKAQEIEPKPEVEKKLKESPGG
jgi:predicted negative regulator of RcsB-dependent stress response